MITKAKISFIKSLSDKKERYGSGLFVAEGIKLVSTLIESGFNVKEVFALAEACDSLPFFHNITTVTPKEMERISHLKTPSEVLALVGIPQYEPDYEKLGEKLSIALDGIQDPGNLGTIIRIADWFGIENVICSKSSTDCYNPKVVQATMGAIAKVKVHYLDLPEWLEDIAGKGIPVYGTFMEGKNIYQAPLTENGIIIMGNEGKGISKEIESFITDKLSIPPYDVSVKSSESLNVAVATAIVCSEFRRRP